MIKHFVRALALLVFFIAAPAAAQTYYFTVTDDETGAVLTRFSLPSSPRPPQISGVTGQYFYFEDVPVTYNGSKNIDYVTFWKVDSATDLVLSYEDPNEGNYTLLLYSVDGTSVYTGSESAPDFKLGTYSVYNSQGSYTLTIGLPEPQTWLMMIIGFGAAGGALRRRHRLRPLELSSGPLRSAA